MLREPLRHEHVKPRLLGHFGTVPGLNLIYVHLNRAIRRRSREMIRSANDMVSADVGFIGVVPDEQDVAIAGGRVELTDAERGSLG